MNLSQRPEIVSDHKSLLKPLRLSSERDKCQNLLPSVDTMVNFDDDYILEDSPKFKRASAETSQNDASSDSVCSQQKDQADKNKTKIVSAIHALNLDRETLRDLKVAFDCVKEDSNEAANALLNLGTLLKAAGPYDPTTEAKRYVNIGHPHPVNYSRMAKPIPAMHMMKRKYHIENPVPFRNQVIKHEEICKILTRIVRIDQFIDIWVNNPKFESRHYQFEMIRVPSKYEGVNCPNAILISANRTMLVTFKNGVTSETVYRGNQVVQLGNRTALGPISLMRMNQGNIRIRIAV
jgi:hypothetical protein